ncbi:MAG: translocation/assembly module TamB domain-containing protein, partial [Caldimonas sp.]
STQGIDSPLTLSLTASDVGSGTQRVDRVKASLDGTLRRHRFDLTASSPLRPPGWTEAAPGAPKATQGTEAHIAATGTWTPGRGNGGSWRGHVAELRATPRSAGTASWIAARDLDVRVDLAPEGTLAEAVLEPGRMEILGNTLRWTQANYQAAPQAGQPPRMALDARLEPVEVAPWLNRLKPDFRWQGDLRVGADVRVRSAARLDADVVVQRSGGDLSLTDEATTRSFGLSELRFALNAHEGVWRVTEAVAGQGIGVLSGAQTMRVASAGAFPDAKTPLDGVLELRVDEVGTWNPWLPIGWRIGGKVRANAALGGTLGAPEYRGKADGSGLSVRNLFEGIDLRDGILAASLDGTDARLEKLAFSGGGKGQLAMSGTAAFGATPQADLKVTADHFLALGRLDRRIVISGSASVGLRGQQIAVNGRVGVDEGLVDASQSDAPHLDGDIVVVNRPTSSDTPRQRRAAETAELTPVADKAAAGKPAASPFSRTDVALVLDLGDNLRLRGHGIDTLLKGQLRITTPDGQLAVNGTVRTVSGTFQAYGQNLAIERGVIVFTGDVATPRLDILAVRPDIDTRVGVTVQGSAVNPRIRLYSDPELSEMDKLSWLVLGRAPAGLGGGDTALLQRAAMALIAGEGGGSGDGVLKKLGLDELSVGGLSGGDVSKAVVTVGKQVSKRLFVGYERGLNSAAGAWSLTYRIARQFTLRLKGGEESALDAIWTWRWN